MAEAPEFLLYGHFESGNVYKVALLLALLDQPFAYRHVALFDGETRADAYRAVNRFQEVPVLEHRGERLCQSAVILGYLADLFGRYRGRDERGRRRVAEWLAWEQQRILAGPALIRFIRRFQADQVPQAVIDYLTPRAERALGQLDRAVAADRFLAGDEPTIADVAASAYLFWLDQAGLEPARWPAIQAWLDRIRALPGFKPAEALLPRP
jgi:glutathione S-transferase